MSDDWEDEEFEVPVFNTNVPSTLNGKNVEDDDEEEMSTKPSVSIAKPVLSEVAIKKAKEEESKLISKLKQSQLENLTPEQRRLKEREIVEKADQELAGELFGTSNNGDCSEDDIARGLGFIPIKTKQDHINFALLCTNKMEDSTPFNILAFYKEVTEQFKTKLTLEGLEEVLKSLTAIRDEKKKTAAAASKTVKKSAKQIKEDSRKAADIYGGGDEYDYGGDSRHAAYSSLEDDFM